MPVDDLVQASVDEVGVRTLAILHHHPELIIETRYTVVARLNTPIFKIWCFNGLSFRTVPVREKELNDVREFRTDSEIRTYLLLDTRFEMCSRHD